MSRIAGDSDTYSFRLCRMKEGIPFPTNDGFELTSVSTFIGDTLAKPPSAMAWWGYRIGLKGVTDGLVEDPDSILAAETPELLEAALKQRGVNPNMKLEAAGGRGTRAHEVLEKLAAGERAMAELAADAEDVEFGTGYGHASIAFWDEAVEPFLESGEILEVRSEVPVWSLRHWYCGTFDLALKWKAATVGDAVLPEGWEILDAKTHKPASGFTKRGAGYISDATQIRAYRMAFEEMGLGNTIGQRTIVLRENGKWLEDKREVSEDFVIFLRRLYDERKEFETTELPS